MGNYKSNLYIHDESAQTGKDLGPFKYLSDSSRVVLVGTFTFAPATIIRPSMMVSAAERRRGG